MMGINRRAAMTTSFAGITGLLVSTPTKAGESKYKKTIVWIREDLLNPVDFKVSHVLYPCGHAAIFPTCWKSLDEVVKWFDKMNIKPEKQTQGTLVFLFDEKTDVDGRYTFKQCRVTYASDVNDLVSDSYKP